jgi:dTDP-4-amino-4,6-dideoxygalactose transaminase
VAAAVKPRTVAVLAVHRFGRPADVTRLRAVGERYGLVILEQDEPDAERDGVAQRRAHAALLDERLTGVLTPGSCPGHTYQQYVVRVPGNGRPDRDAFARAVRSRGVACQVPVTTPLHRLPRFWRDISLPETERAADEALAVPVHAHLSAREMRRIASACNALGGLLQAA